MFYFLNIFSDFCQNNRLNIYWTVFNEICKIGRTLAIDEQSEVIFYPASDVVMATNFVGKIDLQHSPSSSCDIHYGSTVGIWQEGQLLRKAQANELPDSMDTGKPINWSHTHTHTHPFNGPFSGTTQVSRYQKGKTNLDFTEARDSEWQWHQLGNMQVCTLLQTDNHTSTPPLCFIQAGCPSCHPTNSVKALKA